MTGETINREALLEFWFSERVSRQWFRSTPALDEEIRTRFEVTWVAARDGELDDWRGNAGGCLALCILLDQFPLHMFRGMPRSFSTEQNAVEVCLHAIAKGFDSQLSDRQKAFLYMPLMHSESSAHQDLSVRLFSEAGLMENLRFARHHQQLIARFGRFPHRNAILGRPSTSEEQAYLQSSEAFTG